MVRGILTNGKVVFFRINMDNSTGGSAFMNGMVKNLDDLMQDEDVNAILITPFLSGDGKFVKRNNSNYLAQGVVCHFLDAEDIEVTQEMIDKTGATVAVAYEKTHCPI